MCLRFTRYLYETSEVKLSLLISIVNKNLDKALFWAFELFYSGYKEELTKELWIIFYDFYATLNPSFEQYLVKKIKTEINDAATLGAIIHNLITRPYSVDVFILKHILDNNSIIDNNCIIDNTLMDVMKTEDYVKIANYVLNNKSIDLQSMLNRSIQFFTSNCNVKLNSIKEFTKYKNTTAILFNKKEERIILLSRIIHYFHLKYKTKLGKNIFVEIEPNNYKQYETVNIHKPAYKLLPLVTKYNIDDDEYLSLFCLKREKNDIISAYRNNWEYYASFSPIWYKRIHRHNGTVNHSKKKIDFVSDDDIETFYQGYGLEPDEQPLSIQEKSTHVIKNSKKWTDFYKKHNLNGLTQIQEHVNKLNKISYI
jgi:hypothetical protein